MHLIDPTHQIRKLAVITSGRCVVAKIAGDLDQTLLGGGGGEPVGGTEKALAGELKD